MACSGYLISEPESVYRERSRSFLTSHQLADFRRCPALYQCKRLGLVGDIEHPVQLIGRALHTLVLEGRDVFERRFLVTNTGRPMHRTVLSSDQYALVVNLAAAVCWHFDARTLLAEGVGEGVARTQYTGKACQARVDWFHPETGITDLKTCDDLDGFERDARRFGYAHQLAFYQGVVHAALGWVVAAQLIAVEKKPPFRCGVWRISNELLAECRQENEAAIRRLLDCEATGHWPTGFEQPRTLNVA